MTFDIRTEAPVVSISLITYNHAAYIRECLDSMLMQKADFPFEICVGEDASTDGTREICEEYAERNPDRIRLIRRSRTEPGRSDYISQGVYNYIETTRLCAGKYLALCDGDDAWTDPLKLQKQYDIMEADPGISLVHSDYDKIDELSGCTIRHAYRNHQFEHHVNPDKSLFMYDLIASNYPIAASTTFMRTQDVLEIFDNNDELFCSCPMGDIITWCELVNYGRFHFQDESLGIYRLLPDSDSNSIDAEKKYCFVNGASNFGLMVGDKYKLPMDRLRRAKVKHCNRYALLSGDVEEIKRLHADSDFFFSPMENLLYQATRQSVLRAVARAAFMLKYRFNNRRFRAS